MRKFVEPELLMKRMRRSAVCCQALGKVHGMHSRFAAHSEAEKHSHVQPDEDPKLVSLTREAGTDTITIF